MKNKHVILLVIAGVVLGTLAWITSREKVPAGTNRIGEKLLPELAVNAVDEIMIATGAQTARVAKVDNAWVLPARYGYPANFETLRSLMLKLAELKIGQAFKAGDQQRAQMELTEETATTLTLKAGGNPLAVLRLGVNRQSGQVDRMPMGMGGMTDGRYVAIKDDPMVYLIGDSLHEAATDPKRWMDTALLDVQADAVTTISLTNPEDGTFSLIKGQDGKLAFGTPEEGKPFDESKAWSLTGALGYLPLQDVADPAADDATLGFSVPRTFSVSTTNGTTYTLRVSDPIEGSDERYVRIAVAFEAPPLPASDTPPEAKTEKEAATDKVAVAAEANRQAEAAAKALHTRLSPWTYRIAAYKADTLVSSRASLVKQPDPAAEEASNDPSDPSDPTDPTDHPNQPEPEETSNEQ